MSIAPRRETLIRRHRQFQGRVVDLYVDQVRDAGGERHRREVVGHQPAVAVVPMLGRDRLLLIRQFRYAVGRFLWELPAGLVESGESPLAAAKRELKEETGYHAGCWQRAHSIYSSPGFCQEVIHLYLAWDLVRKGNPCPDQDEFLSVKPWDLREAFGLFQPQGIQDGKTLLGLNLAREWSKNKKTGL
ncbi:MAG: NUDIX hydrolase [candidate division FCPU426 bacterium]